MLFCEVEGDWKTIGYAVKEVISEMHDAIENNKIIDINIKWIKFVIYWQTPGLYAGIEKESGQTVYSVSSNSVLCSQSARM